MKKVSLVVPCYNEAGTIPALVMRIDQALSEIAQRKSVEFEVVFVDDGSSDATAERIQNEPMVWPKKIVVLSRNFGKEPALTAGIDVAVGDAVIIMDADLQHPPELIPQLIEHWLHGADIVYFFKRSRQSERIGKNTSASLFYKMINFGARVRIPENSGDFRILDRKAVEVLKQMPERERFMKGMYAWIGFNQLGLPFDVPKHYRDGESRFTFTRLFGLAVDGMTSFSTAPIRLISIFGFFVSLISLVYLLWIVGEWLILGSPFTGFATIVVLVVFFGGTQLICIGIIGEYIGKTLLEAKQRPRYVVSHTIDKTNE